MLQSQAAVAEVRQIGEVIPSLEEVMVPLRMLLPVSKGIPVLTLSSPRDHTSRPTPQSFFNGARRGVRNHALIENAINRLRDEPSQTLAPTKKQRSRNGRDVQREQPQPVAVAPRTNKSLAGTRYQTLVSPGQFMSQFTLDNQPVPQQAPQIVPPQKEIRPPSSVSAQSAQTQISIAPSQATKLSSDAPAKPKVGLLGSMWADPPTFKHVTEVPQAGQRTSLLPERTTTGDTEPSKGQINSEKQQSSHESVRVLPKAGLSASKWASQGSSSQQYLFTGRTPSISSASESHTAKSATARSESSQMPISLQAPAAVAAVPSPLAATPASTAVSSNLFNVQGSASYGGLDASRWAPSLLKPQVSIRTNSVKVQKDGRDEKQDAILRVMKDEIRSPLLLTVELQENGRRVIDETIPMDATFDVVDEVIIYKANDGTSPLWKLYFGLPFQARALHRTILGDPFRPVGVRPHAPALQPASGQVVRPPATALYAQPDTHLNADIDRQFSESLANETTDLISMVSDDECQVNQVNNRISSRTYTFLDSLQGGTQLLDIENDGEEEKYVEQPSAMMDLLVLNDDHIVSGVFQSIDAFYNTFLGRLLESIAVESKLDRHASTQLFMSSPPHIEV